MKVLIYTIVIGLCVILFSCKDIKNKKVTWIAEKYVIEHIAPLFEGATIVKEYPGMTSDLIQHIDDTVVKEEIITLYEKSVFDSKWHARYYLKNNSNEDYKNKLIKNAIKRSEVQALKNANASVGFYNIAVAIKYDEKDYQTFNIIVSKDMKVLNKPIDMCPIHDIIYNSILPND